jgi:simple sugar transport system ATP-binding protein
MTDTATINGEVALELRGMTKRYGAVVACDGVDLDLRRGEIHGILGENGAGKSTLMKMAIGLALPDQGSMKLNGESVRMTDPLEAARHGIGMVHQHYSLVDALTAWENVALGEEGKFDSASTRTLMLEVCEKYGLTVKPDAVVRDLTAGLRQRVEIIKCLRHEPSIIILDEPTSVLTPSESEYLFQVLREGVQREGWAVALVSHKLDEVLAATDRVTIMRDGKVVDKVMTADADAASLARAMVGRDVSLRAGVAAIGAVSVDDVTATAADSIDADPVLEIIDARLTAPDGATMLDGCSFEVRPGEIVGVAGVEGNGQTPLARVLSSLLTLDSGSIRMHGSEVRSGSAGAMMEAGIAVVPADRYHSGCIPEMTVAENLVFSSLDQVSDRGVLKPGLINERAERLIEEFDIHTPGPDTLFGQLSGGNQQRVVLARALSGEPSVLVAHQPTRGLDVGAIEYIGERLRSAADDGIGVLLLSTDLGEIVALSDRIIVMYRGKIIGEMQRSQIDMERLGLLIGGSEESAA